MGSMLYILLALTVLVAFFILMIFVPGNLNRVYIKYILLAYPLLAIDLLPSIISANIFCFTTIIFLIFFYKQNSLERSNKKSLYYFLFILLSVIVLGGLINAENLTLTSIAYLIEYLSIFIFSCVLVGECEADRKFVYQLVNCLKITLFVSLLFMIGQVFIGPSFTIAKSPNINVLSGISIRYTSFFQDPQKYGQFLSACSFFFLIKTSDSRTRQFLNYCLLFFSILAIFMTGGRGALGGWLVAILFLILLGNAKYRLVLFFSIALLAIVAYNYSNSFAIFQRGADLTESYNFRYAIWQDAFHIFLDNPIWGIGIGNYANYVSVHNPDQYWIDDNVITFFDHPESGYLKLLTEYGAIGFLVILLIILIPLYKGITLYFKSQRSLQLILTASVLTWLVGFYTVYSLGDIRILILIATIIGLMIADYKLTTNEVV
jgi:O-antigen ligase